MEQPHITMELHKSLLEQMNNKLKETEQHIRQEIANRVSDLTEWPAHHFTNTKQEQRIKEDNVREMEQWKKRETERHEVIIDGS